MCSQKFRKKSKNKQETKMTKYVLQIYIYTSTFYGFHVLSKFVQSQCLRSDTFAQWLFVGAVITHKMFDAGTKYLSATDGQLEVFTRSMLGTKFNLQITFMYIHFCRYVNPPKFIVDTADIRKTMFLYLFLL